MSKWVGETGDLVKSRILILDGNIAASSTLVLSANEVGNLLILGLLDCRFVVLGSLTEAFLLDVVDCYMIALVMIHSFNGSECWKEASTHPCQGNPHSSRSPFHHQPQS